jgi:hypothetical protein
MTSSQHLVSGTYFFPEESFEVEQSLIYIIVTFFADLNCEIAG